VPVILDSIIGAAVQETGNSCPTILVHRLGLYRERHRNRWDQIGGTADGNGWKAFAFAVGEMKEQQQYADGAYTTHVSMHACVRTIRTRTITACSHSEKGVLFTCNSGAGADHVCWLHVCECDLARRGPEWAFRGHPLGGVDLITTGRQERQCGIHAKTSHLWV
jgi:hypothetical protein